MRGLLVNPLRTGFYEVLEEMGADVSLANEQVQSGEIIAELTIRHAPLQPCHVTAARIPAASNGGDILDPDAAVDDGG